MSKAQFLFALALVPCCALAQNGVVQINQATVAATGANRATNGFPYQITQPGSYQLTGNLVVPAGVDGIDIQSNNVTLDLNGFVISGPGTCTGAGTTLSCAGPDLGLGINSRSVNVTVRNGSVVGFHNGVFLIGQGGLVEEVHASFNQGNGIVLYNGVVRRNTANLNLLGGIVASSSTVTENVVDFNGGEGLGIENGAVFGSNTIQGNGAAPVVNLGSVSQNNNACNGVAC